MKERRVIDVESTAQTPILNILSSYVTGDKNIPEIFVKILKFDLFAVGIMLSWLTLQF
jgi:hypothetical protein